MDESLSDANLPGRVAGLSFFIDRQGNHCRAMLLDQGHDARKARLRSVTVFIIDGVDDRTPTQHFQASFQHRGLGGIEHDRQRGGRRKAPRQFAHVRNTIATDIVDTQIEQVSSITGL